MLTVTAHIPLCVSLASDKGDCVNFAMVDIAGLAALEAAKAADVLHETAPTVRASRITAC